MTVLIERKIIVYGTNVPNSNDSVVGTLNDYL